MTDWTVEVAESAEHDLTDAIDYIRNRLGSSQAAARLLSQFENRVTDLSFSPESHPLVRHRRLAHLGYRWVPVGSYIAFFTVDKERRTVSIERVLYGRSNWSAIL